MCEWPKTTASASGNARRQPRQPAARRSGVVDRPRSARRPRSISVRSGSRAPQRRRRRRCRARRPARGRGRRSPRTLPRWRSRRRGSTSVGRAQALDALVRQPAPAPRQVGVGEHRDRRHAQSSARNASRSAASSSGSSKAAKCPPRSNSVQRRRSGSVRSAHSRGGRTSSRREVGDGCRHLDPLPGRQAPAVARLGRVQAHRRGDRPGRPVDREEVAELVLGEPPLDLALAVRPAPVLVDQPGGEPGGRVVQARRRARRAPRPAPAGESPRPAASAAPPARRPPRPRSSAGARDRRAAAAGRRRSGAGRRRPPGPRTPSGRR